MEDIRVTKSSEHLFDLLKASKADEATQLLTFLQITEEWQQLEMCEYLASTPGATSRLILQKSRQLMEKEDSSPPPMT